MKNIAEINHAHDVASTVLDQKQDMTEEERSMLLSARNALCWVLGHEPANSDLGRWFQAAAAEYEVGYGPMSKAVH